MFNMIHISFFNLAQMCYRLPKCDGTVFNLDLRVKVKLVIANGFLRCSFLLMFNTFHMSILLQYGATG